MSMLLSQTRQIWRDIKGNVFSFLFGLIQVLIAMLLLCYILQLTTVYFDTMSKLHSLTEDGEIYHLQIMDEGDELGILVNDEEKSKVFDEYISYVEDYPVNKFIADRAMCVEFDAGDPPFNKIGEQYRGISQVTAVRVTSNFFDIFQIVGDFNQEKIYQIFNDYSFGEDIPVVLGFDFKKYYKIGDIIRDDMDEKYKVVGFLNRNEYYVAPYESIKAHYLNQSFIIPNNASENDFITLVSTCFQTDNSKILDEMIKKSEDMKLIPLEKEKFTSKIENSKTGLLNEMMTMASVMIVIFIFASIGIISYIVRFIQMRMREFSIHMIYGASEKNILLRIAMQIFLMIGTSIVAALIIFGATLPVLGMTITGVLYCLGLLIYPYITFKRQSIVEILRGNAK